MRIKKCDRCGRTYDDYAKAAPPVLNEDFNTVATGTYDIDNECIGTSVVYDLCPACHHDFVDWFNIKNKRLFTADEGVVFNVD